MGTKEGGESKKEENSTVTKLKEGHNLMDSPSFKPLDNGRFKCLETGHELPAHSAQSKHGRLGLIDSAIAKNKLPLNMFLEDPLCRSKLKCKLTGVTINKTEVHIWKHINGRRFLNMLEEMEVEKEMLNGTVEKQGEEKEEEEKKRDDDLKKNKDAGLRKKKQEENGKVIAEVEDSTGTVVDLEEENEFWSFWMPPVGDGWEHDDGVEAENDDIGEAEGNKQKRNRMKADSDALRLSPSLPNLLDSLANLKGEQVAARVTQEDAEKDEWFIVKVIHFDKETRKFEVLYEESGDDEESGVQIEYKLPMSHIIPFPKRTDLTNGQDFPPGNHVLAVYPGTTALFKATVVQTRKKKTDDYVLEFDDDDDGEGSFPRRLVPYHRVVPLPEGHRQ